MSDMEEFPIAIQIQQLSKRYNSRPDKPDSLKNISLDVPLGKICCLLGPNGSGKTTLLKTLAGLLLPTTGTIVVMGIDADTDPVAVRSSIGWMPAEERSGFYGRLTGRQNLKFFAALNQMSPKETERSIGNLALLLGLNEELDKSILTMSAGTKQKIGLARALLHNPSVLLLDEPLRNLDPHTIVRFRRLLKDHLTRQQKKTIILSTHQLEEAKRVADLIVILRDGEIVRTIDSQNLDHELRMSSLEDFYLKTIDTVPKE